MAFVTVETDDFNRADGGVGANWTTITSESAMNVSSNQAKASSDGSDCGARRNTRGYNPNQGSKAKITSGSSGEQGAALALRIQAGARTYYRICIDDNTGGGTNVRIRRFVAGVSSVIASTNAGSWTDGDTWEATVSGPATNAALEVKLNGVSKLTFTDTAGTVPANGQPGIAYSSTDTAARIDDWEGLEDDAEFISYDTSIESVRTATTDPYTWTHTPNAPPKGIVVAAVHGVTGTNHVQTITYGGVSMTKIVEASDTATEPGCASLWFLGSSIPTGAQTISADLDSATGDDIHFISWSLFASDDTEVIDFDELNENAANPTVTLTASSRFKISIAAMYAGGAAPGGTIQTGNTQDHNHDLGNFYSDSVRETVPDASDHTIGWSTLTSDDLAFVAIAVAPVSGAEAFELSLDPGSYAITGSVAGLLEAAILSLSPGSYAVTGAQAQLVRGRFLNLAPGSYALTGAQAQLLQKAVLNLAPGSYAVTGAVSQLVRGLFLSLAPGSYALTGFDADLVHEFATAFEIALDPGSYAITGTPDGLIAARMLSLAPGSYAITGAVQQLLAARVLSLVPGAYNLTGAEAQLFYSAAQVAATRFRTLMGLGT